MPYGTDTDPYLDPISGVLCNSLGIADADELARSEADLTAELLTSLSEHQYPGNFDLVHLQSIHRGLFGSIYTWAGKLRTVEITKGTTRFAAAEFLQQSATELFTELKADDLLGGLRDEAYNSRLAYYYSEVNILHPFREGNGRTQRAFFTLLAAKSGRYIAWERMDPAENLAASIAAYNGDESDLVTLLTTLIEPV